MTRAAREAAREILHHPTRGVPMSLLTRAKPAPETPASTPRKPRVGSSVWFCDPRPETAQKTTLPPYTVLPAIVSSVPEPAPLQGTVVLAILDGRLGRLRFGLAPYSPTPASGAW